MVDTKEYVKKYIHNLKKSIDICLKEQLNKLGINENDKKIISEHCRQLNYPLGTVTRVPGDSATKISDYFFEDILLMRVQREADGLHHSILVVKEFDDETKNKAKSYII